MGTAINELQTNGEVSASAIIDLQTKINGLSQDIDALEGVSASSIGDMVFQSASAVVITGGTISMLTTHQNLSGSNVHNLGNMASQSASTVNITGGYENGVKFGTSTDYSSFESDGTLKFSGSATVFKDLIMTGTNLRPGNSAPSFSAFTNGIYAFAFGSGKIDELHGAVEFQHDYKEGTSIEPHVHWSPSSTNVGTCAWKYEYSIANMTSGSFPSSIILTPTSGSISSGITNSHQYTSFGSIAGTIAGSPIKIGSIIVFRVYRDGTNDSFTGNAFLHSVGIHYEVDTIGSRETSIK